MKASQVRNVAEHANLAAIVDREIATAVQDGKHFVDLRALGDRYSKYPEEIDDLKRQLRDDGFTIVTEAPAQENYSGQIIISWAA